MICPRCGYRFVCPCLGCKDRTRGRITWKWDTAGDDRMESCGVCGLTADHDQWFEEQMLQAANAVNSPVQMGKQTLLGYRARPGKT